MTEIDKPPAPAAEAVARRNFYGRVRGKTLRASQKTYLADDLGPLTLRGVSREDNPERRGIDLARVFGDRPVWVEIGFGGGEHLVQMAQRHAGVALIGCEPFVNGVAMLLGRIREAGVETLRIHPGDARDLFDVLPKGLVQKAFLNYPDPWPKVRHHRRRFVVPETLAGLARVMARGAEFRVATDIADYVRQTLDEVPAAGFELLAQGDVAWDDWISTRYEVKALREGRVPHYMTFRRV